MFDVVATNDDELTLAVEIEHIDDIEASRAIAGPRRANFSSEQEPEDVKHQERGEQERHDCSEYGEQL